MINKGTDIMSMIHGVLYNNLMKQFDSLKDGDDTLIYITTIEGKNKLMVKRMEDNYKCSILDINDLRTNIGNYNKNQLEKLVFKLSRCESVSQIKKLGE